MGLQERLSRRAVNRSSELAVEKANECVQLVSKLGSEIKDMRASCRTLASAQAKNALAFRRAMHEDMTYHEQRLNAFTGLSFWGRLRWLLTGRFNSGVAPLKAHMEDTYGHED